jgi:hypothetical protein
MLVNTHNQKGDPSMSSCDDKNTCSTTAASSDCCPVEKSLKGACCPIEAATELWTKSFFTALRDVQVDILKEKIRKAYGPVMDKAADATVEAMGAHWQAVLTQGKAQFDLKQNIANIYGSAKK